MNVYHLVAGVCFALAALNMYYDGKYSVGGTLVFRILLNTAAVWAIGMSI